MSSHGGMTIVKFDNPEHNKGRDGHIYSQISVPSIALRKSEDA